MNKVGETGGDKREIEIVDGFEEDRSLDRFKTLSEPDFCAMSQKDARWLLEELRYEEVDGPVQNLIYSTSHPPLTIIRLVKKADLPAGEEVCQPTLEEMEAFLEFCSDDSHQLVRTSVKILANPFVVRRLRMQLPKYITDFLDEMKEAEESEPKEIGGARKRILELVEPGTKSA